MSVVTRSTFNRYLTDTRPTSNQCHDRYSVDIATDIYTSTWKWRLVDFPKNPHTKSVCRLIIGSYKKGLRHSPSRFGNWVTEVCKIKWFLGKTEESHLECCFAKKLFTCYWIFFFVKILRRKDDKDLRLVWAKVRYCLQKEIFFEVFTLFFPKLRSFTCFEDSCPQLTLDKVYRVKPGGHIPLTYLRRSRRLQVTTFGDLSQWPPSASAMDRLRTQICAECKSNWRNFQHFTCRSGSNRLTGVRGVRRWC